MSAKITIYNDGMIDFQVIRLNPRSGAAIEHKHIPAEDESSRECNQFRLSSDEILIISTAESTAPSEGE
jgi:hypothetical protein